MCMWYITLTLRNTHISGMGSTCRFIESLALLMGIIYATNFVSEV